MIDRKTKLDFGVPFMWLIRFVLYLRTANKAEGGIRFSIQRPFVVLGIAWRKFCVILLGYIVAYAIWFAIFNSSEGMIKAQAFIGESATNILLFLLTSYSTGILSNFYSREHFTNESWEHLIGTQFRIPFLRVPDIRLFVPSKSFRSIKQLFRQYKATLNQFPIGWSREFGWIWYGFRRPYDPPEVYRHHVAFVGELGMGSEAMRDVLAMRAFEITPDNLFIMLDSDAGGLSFDMYKDMWGFCIYRTHTDCMKAIHYVSQVLLDRRKRGIKNGTQIIVMADASASTAFIGRSPGTRHYKPVMGAIQNIVSAGKMFGIHLVIFPPPDFYENAVTNYPKHEFSRHYFQFAQYYSTEFTEIKTPDGKPVGFRAIDAPAWGIGDFNWSHQGQKIIVKDAPPKSAQVLYRIKESLLYYPQHAKALWDKFRYFDFLEYPVLDLEQKVKEKPIEQPKEKSRRECPVCTGRGRMLQVTIDTKNRIVKFNCLKIKGGCGHKWEQHIADGVTLDISEGVAIGGNGKNGIGEEIIPKPPNFTEDYHYKS